VTSGFVESSTVGNALGADTASVSYKAGSLTSAVGTGIVLNVATSGIFGAADATVSLTRGAIQVGVGIANGSTESVFSGLASIGLELLPGALPSGTSSAGRGLANAGDDAGSLSRNASGVDVPNDGGTVTRYMTLGEVDETVRTGNIPNYGSSGEPRPTHVTTDPPVNSANEAARRYEIDPPTHRATVPSDRVTDLGPAPDGRATTSGGGSQAATNDPIPVKPEEIHPLDK